jgi:hypothetical protein
MRNSINNKSSNGEIDRDKKNMDNNNRSRTMSNKNNDNNNNNNSNNGENNDSDEGDNNERVPWDYKGMASSYMDKKGHVQGRGLGRNQDGIREPIVPSKTSFSSNNKKTVMIVGTSMVGGLKREKMSKKYLVKVRPHPGATLKQIKHHLSAHLIENKTEYLILQVGTNDAVKKNTSPQEIFEGIMLLKELAEELSPGIKVTISCPMVRTDDQMANEKLLEVKRLIKDVSGLSIISNDNIGVDHLSTKGLHLSPSGTTQLAKNMISFMQNIGRPNPDQDV